LVIKKLKKIFIWCVLFGLFDNHSCWKFFLNILRKYLQMNIFSVNSINSVSNQLNTSGTSTGAGSLLSQSPSGVIADAVGADKLPSFLGASSSSGGDVPTTSPLDQLT